MTLTIVLISMLAIVKEPACGRALISLEGCVPGRGVVSYVEDDICHQPNLISKGLTFELF